VKRYEALFILNPAVLAPAGKDGKEDGLKDAIDKISAELEAAGGKIETVQKMDKKSFARVADKRHAAGVYVNVIFEGKPESLVPLRIRFGLSGDVFRVLFTEAAPAKAAAAAAQ
jgi:ribosomal protein S6